MLQKRSIIRRASIVPTEVMSPYWRAPLDLVAADISPSGMYLISDNLPRIGEFVFCTFGLVGAEDEYRLLTKVKRLNFHRRKTDRIRPGFGVQFLGVDERDREKLHRALQGLPPPIPAKRRVPIVPKPNWRYPTI